MGDYKIEIDNIVIFNTGDLIIARDDHAAYISAILDKQTRTKNIEILWFFDKSVDYISECTLKRFVDDGICRVFSINNGEIKD